jgi:hypothetical protein
MRAASEDKEERSAERMEGQMMGAGAAAELSI